MGLPAGTVIEFLAKDPRVNLYARLYEPRYSAAELAIRAFRELEDTPAPVYRYTPLGGYHGGRKPPHNGRKPPHDGRKPPHDGRKPPHDGRKPATYSAVAGRPFGLAERGEYYEAYRLFALYTKANVSEGAAAHYRAELAAHRRSENGLRAAQSRARRTPYHDFGFAASTPAPIALPITAIYDEEGRRHDWSNGVTYIYGAPGEPSVRIEGGPTGARAARLSGALTAAMTLIDTECPVCHVLRSATGDLDPAKTERSVRASTEIEAFYVFYRERCPAGALHRWAGRGCAACGLGFEALEAAAAGQAMRSRDARAYYETHLARFAAERLAAAPPPAVRPPAVAADAAEQLVARAASWQPDYTHVVRAAELGGVTPETLDAIGAMAGREYADVVEGRGAPPPPTARSDPRIYAADAEVRAFMASYGTLRRAGHLAKVPAATADLLMEAEAPRHELMSLDQMLPEVDEDYHAMFAECLRRRPAAIAHAYAIQSLCRMVLAVAGAGAGWVARLAQLFAQKELGRVVRGQRLLSKPGTFNWSIFELGDDPLELAEQVGDVGEDLPPMDVADDPYSGENIDYDTSEQDPNTEPA